MRTRTRQGLQTLRRAHQFLAGGTYQTAIGDLTPHVEVLGRLVQEMTQHVADAGHRAQAARVATDDKRAKGDALLLEYLRPIARLADTLFATDSTARAGFRLPRRWNEEVLLQVAEAFVEQCVQHQARFIAGGLAPDFVQRVREAVDAYRTAITTRGLVVGRRVAATAGMEHLLLKGREQVRVIDALLVPRLTSQPDALAEWRSIARFVRRSTEGADAGTGSGEVGTPGALPAGAGSAPAGQGGALELEVSRAA
jgi:hypothetical protein